MNNRTTPISFNRMRLVNLRLMWVALLFSHFVYAFVLYTMISQNSAPEANVHPYLVPIYCSMSTLALIIGIFLPRFILGLERKKIHLKFGATNIDSLETQSLMNSYAPAYMIRVGFFETIVLQGFVLAVQFKRMDIFFVFATVSFLAILTNFPKEEKIKAAFK